MKNLLRGILEPARKNLKIMHYNDDWSSFKKAKCDWKSATLLRKVYKLTNGLILLHHTITYCFHRLPYCIIFISLGQNPPASILFFSQLQCSLLFYAYTPRLILHAYWRNLENLRMNRLGSFHVGFKGAGESCFSVTWCGSIKNW